MPADSHAESAPAVIGSRYRWQALAIVSLGTFTVHLDTTVNVALPAITDALAAPLASIQWIIIAYVLTTASTLVGVGRLADLVGRRAIWCWGLIALAAALVLVSFAPSIWVVVGCRMLQAVGATMVYAAGPALVTEAFPGAQRGRALGIMTLGGQLGMAVGPLFGGWLVSTFGWPSIFWARAPIALAVGLLSFWLIRDLTPARAGGRFDGLGAVTLGLAMVALLFGVNRAGALGWSDPLPVGLFVTAVALLGAFILVESRVTSPMLDLRLFQSRMFSAANAMNLIANLTMFGVWLLVPYYLVDGIGLAPLMAGLFLCSVPLATAVISPLAGWLADRYGPAWPSLAGLLAQVGALLMISRLDAASDPLDVAIALALLGGATGLFMAPNLSYIMGSVPREQLGVAGGVVTTMRSLGVVTGVALLTTIYDARSEVHAPGGGVGFVVPAFQDAFTFAAMICTLAVGLALIRGRAPGAVRSR